MRNSLKNTVKVIGFNCKKIKFPSFFIYTVFINMCICFGYKDIILNNKDFTSVLKYIFNGPSNFDYMIYIFIYTIITFFIVLIVGNYIYNEMGVRCYYTITRHLDIKTWIRYIEITSMIYSILYYFIGILTILIYSLVVGKTINISFIYVFKIISLMSISIFYHITIYILLILVLKKHVISFITLLIISLTSIEFGDVFGIDKFIPFNQGILSKHIIGNYTFSWSIIYLLILIIFNLFLITKIISKKDFCDLVI